MQNVADKAEVDSDFTVIQKVLNGDITLFEVLIRRYNTVLYKIARSYGFNHQDAEDLMQDTHVSAYTGLKNFERRSSYKTWISRIMVNKCLYKLKYGHFKNEVPTEHVMESNNEPIYSKSKDTQTEDVFLNRELRALLEKSVESIPVIYRTVFVLREVEGFSVAETAELLNITPMNVKVRLNRAKTLLQKQMESFYSHNELFSFNLVYCNAMVNKVIERITMLDKSPIQ